MAGENSSRRSRRRRRPRRSRKKNRQNKAKSVRMETPEQNYYSAEKNDELPDVFIYTYTIYKTGD